MPVLVAQNGSILKVKAFRWKSNHRSAGQQTALESGRDRVPACRLGTDALTSTPDNK
jgi:hypothetical protein